MRAHTRPLSAALLVAVLCLACQSRPPRETPDPGRAPGVFDADRAWTHLEALAGIGPRVAGGEGAAQARAYLTEQLQSLGLSIREQSFTGTVAVGEQRRLVNLAAEIPGESDDLILLLAPYDSREHAEFSYLGVNDGASGAAALLEIARVLAANPLHYTTWIVFLDGESIHQGAGPLHYGATALAIQLGREQVLRRVRLGLVLNRVCDSDLRIARDLMSHRIYREELWRAAARIGHREAFPADAPFESPVGSHLPLVRAGLARMVALLDPSFGGDEPPGLYDHNEQETLEHCSPESLATVGQVALEGLGSIAARLKRIDRFADAPAEAPPPLSLDLLIDEKGEEGAPAQEPPAAGGEPGEASP